VADGERLGRLQVEPLDVRAVPGEIQLDVVVAWLQVQTLQHAVEIVDAPREVAIDEHFGLPRVHLQPDRGAVVVAVTVARVPLRVAVVVPGVVEPGIGVVVRTIDVGADVHARADADADTGPRGGPPLGLNFRGRDQEHGRGSRE
jgi:hypothetical protein